MKGEAGNHGFRHLGRTLCILRGLEGIPRAELARRAQCGVSQVSRSKIESGRACPNVETLGRLLEALDITPLGLGFALATGLRSCRPGDRILWNREVVWTELTDGAAWETDLFLEADYMAELKADLHRLTAAGLTAEGKSEIFMLQEDLPPEKRPRLLEATARPARNVPPVEIDRDFLDASARQLRDLARSFDPEGKE